MRKYVVKRTNPARDISWRFRFNKKYIFWFLQDQVDPGELSDAATYENLRAPPRCVGDTADTGVHFVTVHQLSK